MSQILADIEVQVHKMPCQDEWLPNGIMVEIMLRITLEAQTGSWRSYAWADKAINLMKFLPNRMVLNLVINKFTN